MKPTGKQEFKALNLKAIILIENNNLEEAKKLLFEMYTNLNKRLTEAKHRYNKITKCLHET